VQHDDLVAAFAREPLGELGGKLGVRRPVDGQQDSPKHRTVTSW
jgi:hypothetical protein